MNSTPEKDKKPLWRLLIMLVVAGLGFAWYQFNRPTGVFKKPSMETSATQLVRDYVNNEARADSTYAGKVLAVVGKIASTNHASNLLVLEAGPGLPMVSCSFKAGISFDPTSIQPGQMVEISGICSGYLMDVQLTQCRLQHKKNNA